MVVFVDWIGLVGGSISTIFSWTAFNRDSFAYNTVQRQNQKYQQKGYHISWVAIARNDIRDMMGISVNRINNYMLVAALILTMALGVLMSLSFAQPFPGFLMYASYLSIGISFVFLMISIAFGLHGQNMAYCSTMELLTLDNGVRPQNPPTFGYDYTSQAQWIEKKGIRALFRIPGVAPETYESGKHKAKASTSSRHVEGSGEEMHARNPLTPFKPSNGIAVNSPDEQSLEDLHIRQRNLWYLQKYRRFMELWQPFETWCNYSKNIGLLSFCHGLAYWSLGKTTSEHLPFGRFAGVAMIAPYISAVILIALWNLGVNLGDKTPKTKTGRLLLQTLIVTIVTGGPVVNGLSTLTVVSLVWQQVFILVGYFLHCVFWLLCFITGCQKKEETLYQTHCIPEEIGSEDDGPMDSSFRQRHSADKPADPSRKHRLTPSKCTFGVEASTGDKWLVDDEEFDRSNSKRMQHTLCFMQLAMASSALIWFSMCVWVVFSYFATFDTSFDRSGVRATRFSVDWPDPRFKPGQLACAAENKTQMKHVFIANKFSIYSLQFEQGVERLKRSKKPINCGKLEGEIIDMSALCGDYGDCRPFVLIRNNEFTKIVDCARPEEESLLKWSGLPAPNFIEVKPDGLGLIIEHDSSLVIWTRANSTSAWMPQYDLGFRHNDISDIDYGFGDIVFFRNVRAGWFQTAIEQLDAKSFEKKRAWRIPQSLMPLAAGCMMMEGVQALVLPSDGQEVGSRHYLTRLDLNL